MLWNLYLAAIPTVLALALFRRPTRLDAGWCLTSGAWVLFLPTAPYVLTDIVHMRGDLHASRSRGTAAVLLTYSLFAAAGLVSYVVSMQLFRRFLHRLVPRRTVLPVLLVVHG